MDDGAGPAGRWSSEHRPDVAIVDVRMPPTLHRRGAARRAAWPGGGCPALPVLVLSQYVEQRYAARAARPTAPAASATCSRTGSSTCGEFLDALRRVGRRRHRARPRGRRPAARPAPPATSARSTALTPREREVLALMAEGRSNAAIAGALRGHRAARSSKHIAASSPSSTCRPSDDDHRRVLAVLAYLPRHRR